MPTYQPVIPINQIPAPEAIVPLRVLALRVGENGQMLIEQPDGTYVKADANASMDISKPQPPAFPGYPSGGKFYSYGKASNEIMAAGVPVTIDVPGTIHDRHILKVLPDGSFYVLVQATATNLPNAVDGAYSYVMHYAADGKLIERARLFSPLGAQPAVWQMAFGPGGELYAEASDLIDTGRVDLVRLIFRSASEPLPAVPASAVPTPVLPTPVPTIEQQAPAPMPTAPNAGFHTQTPWPTATPQPTPIADLATLAGKAEVIARVRLQSIEPWNSGVLPFGAEILEWIKRPNNLITNNLNVDVFLGANGEIRVAPVLRSMGDMGEGEYIVFLNKGGTFGSQPSFAFADDTSGLFSIVNGAIDYAGIPTYKAWSVDQFKAAFRRPPSLFQLLSRPSLNLCKTLWIWGVSIHHSGGSVIRSELFRPGSKARRSAGRKGASDG